MIDTPLSQPAPSLSADTCVRAVIRPVAAESVSASLDLMFGPLDHRWRWEGTVVEMVHSKSQVDAAVDQVKGHLLHVHVTLIPTNNHYSQHNPTWLCPKTWREEIIENLPAAFTA